MMQVLVLALLALGGPGWTQECVRSFHCDLTLTSDATLRVRETITVHAEQQEIRHGIYREIATHYRDCRGQWVTLTLRDVQVQRDGMPELVRGAEVINGTRLYLGRPDVSLTPGDHTYILSYTAIGAVSATEGGQTLYWNATGYAWQFPIESTTVTLALQEGIARDTVRQSAYCGRRGENTEKYTTQVDSDGRYRYFAYDEQPPGDAFIVMADFPAMLHLPAVTSLPLWQRLDPALKYGGLGLLLITGYYLLAWWCFGRAPVLVPHATPHFTPPGNLPPAVLRYIWRMGYDTKTLAVSLIELSLHGIITIVHHGTQFRLESDQVFYWNPERHLLQELAPGIPVHLSTLARRLGERAADVRAMVGTLIERGVPLEVDRDVVHLRLGEPSTVPLPAGTLHADAWRLVYDLLGPTRTLRLDENAFSVVKPAIVHQRRYLDATYERRYFNANRWVLLPGILFSCIVVGYVAYGDFSGIIPTTLVVAARADDIPPLWISPLVHALQPLLNTLLSGLVMFFTEALVCKRGVKHYIVLGSLIVLPVALLVILHVQCGAFNHFPAAFLLVTFLLWGVNLLFARLLKAPTALGQRLFDSCRGFAPTCCTPSAPRTSTARRRKQSPLSSVSSPTRWPSTPNARGSPTSAPSSRPRRAASPTCSTG